MQEKAEERWKKRRKSPGRRGEKLGVKAGWKNAGGKANPARTGSRCGVIGENGPWSGSGKFPEDQLIERSVSRTPGWASVQALSTLTITGSTPFRIGLKRHMLTFGSRRTASKSFS